MSVRLLAFLFAQLAPALLAKSDAGMLRICTDDRAGLDALTVLHMRRAAEEMTQHLGVRPVFQGCGGGSVRVRILIGSTSEPDVLGKARVADARVLPDVHLYVRHIERRITQVNPIFLGRALGRVLAHELSHYVLQMRSHDAHGLLGPVFDETALSAPDVAKLRAFTENSPLCH